MSKELLTKIFAKPVLKAAPAIAVSYEFGYCGAAQTATDNKKQKLTKKIAHGYMQKPYWFKENTDTERQIVPKPRTIKKNCGLRDLIVFPHRLKTKKGDSLHCSLPPVIFKTMLFQNKYFFPVSNQQIIMLFRLMLLVFPAQTDKTAKQDFIQIQSANTAFFRTYARSA